MTYVSEILFVDPSVDDIETILRNLRPGVEAKSARSAKCRRRDRSRRRSTVCTISTPSMSLPTARRAE